MEIVESISLDLSLDKERYKTRRAKQPVKTWLWKFYIYMNYYDKHKTFT